ncbi:MAG: glycine/sarcosine/betaine reductase selenoprotein B family protein [Deltaproteobacteria bacterium]
MPEKQTIAERVITKIFSRFPAVSEMWAKKFQAHRVEGIPWTPFVKELSRCKVAIVTTAGVHLKSQKPFDMEDKEGDPTFREVPKDAPKSSLTITHKYYDHADADKDINIIFPVDRLSEMKERGEIGEVAEINYSFMGHILGRHVKTLVEETAPEVAGRLKSNNVDIVLLTPG